MVKDRRLKNIQRLIDFEINNLPIDQMFVADLKSVIEKIDQKNSRKPSKYYKPSSMKCLRNMYFQRIGQPTEESSFDSCMIGICETGSARHSHIQSYISQMQSVGIDCEYIDVSKYIEEMKLDYLKVIDQVGHETKLLHSGLGISFMCDGIIRYQTEYFIFEFKTESTYKFSSRNEIAEEHVSQGVAYSVCFGINKVLFVYENRDNCDKKAFLLTVTDGMKYDNIISKIEACDQFVSKQAVPPKPEDVTKKVCTYCAYKTACRKAGEDGG